MGSDNGEMSAQDAPVCNAVCTGTLEGIFICVGPQQPYSKHLVRASQQGSLVHDNEWSLDHENGNHHVECWSLMETTVLAACRKGHEQGIDLLF